MFCYLKLLQDLISMVLIDFQIGETIADKASGKPLPAIKVEEPTVKMAFSINTSPFVGREVFFVLFAGAWSYQNCGTFFQLVYNVSLSLNDKYTMM